MSTVLLLLPVFTVGYTLIAKRLKITVITAPMVFLALGYGLSSLGDIQQPEIERVLHVVAEVALIVLLFIDAAQIDLKALQRQHAWPQRMLLIGLPGRLRSAG